jgi:hypothetical protein
MIFTSGILTVGSLALAAMAQEFSNPVIWEDLADNEVIRVGDGKLYISSC